jgi:ADP-heptose:LPS heptosyltransferase
MSLSSTLKYSAVQLARAAEPLLRGKASIQPADLAGFRDFLFLQYMMPLGYCVHDTPVYQALRQCRPDARITVATHGTGFETLRHNPYIDHLVSTESPFTGLLKASDELRAALRRHQVSPRVGVTNCSNARTRIALLNLLAGRHVRLGHTLTPGLYHLPQTCDRGMSLIDNNLRLLENFGCSSGHLEPQVFFSESDMEKARMLLERSGLTAGAPLVIFVTQGSGGQRTGWYRDRFAQVIRHAAEVLRLQVAFAGTAADAPAIDELRKLAGQPGTQPAAQPGDTLLGVSMAGKTTIPQLSALLCMSDYVVSLDTGTMHVARAAGVPMVVLGPSWQKPLEWLPLGKPQVRILRGEDIDHVPEGYQLDEIEVRAVIGALDELVKLYPASHIERSARLRSSLSSVDHA